MIMYKMTFKVFVFNNYIFNIFSLTGKIFWLMGLLPYFLDKEQNKMELFKTVRIFG